MVNDTLNGNYAHISPRRYQTEPHAPFPTLPSREDLRPALPPVFVEAREQFIAAVISAIGSLPDQTALLRIAHIGESFYAGRFTETLQLLTSPQP